MCRRVQCSKCSRPTYAGCGAHIEQVLSDVAPADRCRCREQPAGRDASKPVDARSWLDRVLGK